MKPNRNSVCVIPTLNINLSMTAPTNVRIPDNLGTVRLIISEITITNHISNDKRLSNSTHKKSIKKIKVYKRTLLSQITLHCVKEQLFGSTFTSRVVKSKIVLMKASAVTLDFPTGELGILGTSNITQ